MLSWGKKFAKLYSSSLEQQNTTQNTNIQGSSLRSTYRGPTHTLARPNRKHTITNNKDLWPVLQPAVRGRSTFLAFIFRATVQSFTIWRKRVAHYRVKFLLWNMFNGGPFFHPPHGSSASLLPIWRWEMGNTFKIYIYYHLTVAETRHWIVEVKVQFFH